MNIEHLSGDQPEATGGAESPPAKRVVVVGGGITGLAAAWRLQQEAASRGVSLRYTVLEGSDRWGGKVYSEQVGGFGDTPFTLEWGADAFLTRKPWAVALAREVGLEPRMQGVNQANARTYVLHRGQPTPIPEGVQLLAPTNFWPFVRSPLFSVPGKLRVGLDLIIPSRRQRGDESLGQFVTRRFGTEALDTLAEPMLSGVYNGVPAKQSLLATFPQYAAMEQQYGSVIRGLRAAAHKREPTDESSRTLPAFISFDTGTQALVNALVGQLTGDLRLRATVEGVECEASGGYRVTLAGGSQLPADAVIVTTLAHEAAALLREAAPHAAHELRAIGFTSIGSLYLAFHRDEVVHPLDGFGVVIPSSERRRIDGMTWTSSKWTGRGPADYVLLRVFFGGPHTRDTMALSDDDLLAVVRQEVDTILGARATPSFHRIYRWPEGYPQYDVGHLDRVTAIEARLPPGVYVAGSSYRGVGVPDCVRQGQEAATRALTWLAT
jgi:protoporphyrinogen/coproporphyrinogen III oxidase